MRTPARLLLIVAPVVFLFGLWLGLSKPGWSPRVGVRAAQTLQALCPPGLFQEAIKNHLKEKEGIDLQVHSGETPQEYFQWLHERRADFDVVCVASHHLSESQLENHFAPLAVSEEWRLRRLHPDFRSLPADKSLTFFWPVGWRVYLPAVNHQQEGSWPTTGKGFELFLEEDFREVLHLYLAKGLLRPEWLEPEHTDPLATTLSAPAPQWQWVGEEGFDPLLKDFTPNPSDPVRLLYMHHVHWEGLPKNLKESWIWGAPGLPGNLQVMGLLAAKEADPQPLDQLIRALARPQAAALLAQTSQWATPLREAAVSGPLSASFLRTLPLTAFQMTSGLDPNALFWERVVHSASQSADPTESAQ